MMRARKVMTRGKSVREVRGTFGERAGTYSSDF